MVAPPFLEAAGHSSSGEAIKFLSYVLGFINESEQARKGRLGGSCLCPPCLEPGLTSHPDSPVLWGPQRPSVAGALSLGFTERTRVQSSLLDPGTGLPATSAQGGSIMFSGTKAPLASPAAPLCPSPMLHGHWAWLPLTWLLPLTRL